MVPPIALKREKDHDWQVKTRARCSSRHSERDIAGGRCVRSQLRLVPLQDGGAFVRRPHQEG